MDRLKKFMVKHKKTFMSIAISLAITVLLPVIIFLFFDWRTAPERVAARERAAFINSLTREDFVYDINYMLTVLEENFPSFGVIYSRNGVDMHVKGQNIREYIENPRNRIDFYRFWSVLSLDYFYHAFPIGHLRIVSPEARHLHLTYALENLGLWSNSAFWIHYVNAFKSPASQLAYPALSREVMEAVEASLAPDDNLTIEIIEEGRIAYLGVAVMLLNISDGDRDIIRGFYDEIADFEHLIIDIRGNGGGWVRYFDELIAGPLMGSRINSARFYHFMLNGGYNMDYMRVSGQNVIHRGRTPSGLLEQYEHYSAKFGHHFTVWHHVRPTWQSNFYGKIWMLIDEGVFSASQMVAEFYKQAGFATFVGETTGGMVATPMGSNFFSLPNTGIIIRYDPTLATNRNGRPLEYGTDPHHFNRLGMDALETTLALIAEENY